MKIGDLVVLPPDPELGIPEQRAHIIGNPDNGVLMVCVLPEDRLEGDADGLTEVPFQVTTCEFEGHFYPMGGSNAYI